MGFMIHVFVKQRLMTPRKNAANFTYPVGGAPGGIALPVAIRHAIHFRRSQA
jgi:hypothetical protein